MTCCRDWQTLNRLSRKILYLHHLQSLPHVIAEAVMNHCVSYAIVVVGVFDLFAWRDRCYAGHNLNGPISHTVVALVGVDTV
jgi:hypothetical protein